jgi:uncharacterized protein
VPAPGHFGAGVRRLTRQCARIAARKLEMRGEILGNIMRVASKTKARRFGPVKLVVIQSTSFCNLDCDYCYLPYRSSKNNLSLDLIRKLFSSNFIDEEFTIVWHAGEPLALPIAFYEAAFEKISELERQFNTKRRKITHAIQTNGTLLAQDWCDFIKKYRIKLGVSVDGPDFIHDAHRKRRSGRGSHAETMRGVFLLQRNDISFNVITVLTQDSLSYPGEMFDFFIKNRIRHIGFNVEEVEGIHKSSSLQKAGTETSYRAFMEKFYALTKGTNGALKVREFEHIRGLILQEPKANVGQFTPFSIISIDHKGNFSTFSPELLSMDGPVYGDFLLGNILHDTFESVCRTEKFRRIDTDIQEGVALCRRTCGYFSVCGGGAPANKYFENNTFRSTETMYCRLTKKILVDIILADIERSLGLQRAAAE